MADIDQDFIEYIVKSLVGQPDEVKIERSIDEKGVLLTLTVADDDLGRVIGKRGATAQSLRTLLRALGTKNEARYNLKIADGDSPPPRRERRDYGDNHGSSDRRDSRRGGSDRKDSRREDSPRADSDREDSEPAHTSQTDENSPLSSDFASPDSSQDDSQTNDGNDDAFAEAKKELADLDDLDI